MQLNHCEETNTWFNRNGTFLRVLIAVDHNSADLPALRDIDVTVQRLIVIATCGVDQLNESTDRFRFAAEREGVGIISADGHHRYLIEQISLANSIGEAS
jgi:hypothetical protein